MSQENKISEEHLVTVKEFTNFFANAKLALGDATLRYETDKTNILAQTKAKDEEFVSFETGEYTSIEETEVVKEN